MAHKYDIEFCPPTEAACKEVARFLTPMYFEVARLPGDPVKIIQEIYRIARDECLLLVRCDGAIAGSAGLIRANMWYAAKGECLGERWFYVAPAYRANPVVLRLMLREVQKLADATGLLAVLNIFNRSRFERGQAKWRSLADMVVIRPAGTQIVYEPESDHGRYDRKDHQHDAEHVDLLPGVDAASRPVDLRQCGELAKLQPDDADL